MPPPQNVIHNLFVVAPLEGVVQHHYLEESAAEAPDVQTLRVPQACKYPFDVAPPKMPCGLRNARVLYDSQGRAAGLGGCTHPIGVQEAHTAVSHTAYVGGHRLCPRAALRVPGRPV